MKRINWKNLVVTLLAIGNILLISKLDNDVAQVHVDTVEDQTEVERLTIHNEIQKQMIVDLKVERDELLGDIDYWYRQYDEQRDEAEYYKSLLNETDEI